MSARWPILMSLVKVDLLHKAFLVAQHPFLFFFQTDRSWTSDTNKTQLILLNNQLLIAFKKLLPKSLKLTCIFRNLNIQENQTENILEGFKLYKWLYRFKFRVLCANEEHNLNGELSEFAWMTIGSSLEAAAQTGSLALTRGGSSRTNKAEC